MDVGVWGTAIWAAIVVVRSRRTVNGKTGSMRSLRSGSGSKEAECWLQCLVEGPLDADGEEGHCRCPGRARTWRRVAYLLELGVFLPDEQVQLPDVYVTKGSRGRCEVWQWCGMDVDAASLRSDVETSQHGPVC